MNRPKQWERTSEGMMGMDESRRGGLGMEWDQCTKIWSVYVNEVMDNCNGERDGH